MAGAVDSGPVTVVSGAVVPVNRDTGGRSKMTRVRIRSKDSNAIAAIRTPRGGKPDVWRAMQLERQARSDRPEHRPPGGAEMAVGSSWPEREG